MMGATGSWRVDAYANLPLAGTPTPTEAVVVVHGTGRNAAGYFASMMAAATKAGVLDHTLVIASHFETSADPRGPGVAAWSSSAWKIGEPAAEPSGLSSFTVIDQVLASLADRRRFPNLRRITVAGHSAGAQLVQRYAAFGQAPTVLTWIDWHFVVANPSSFVYFGPTRPSGGGFAVPSASSCSGYNTYKYGMSGRVGYPTQLTPAQAAHNYITRQITLLSGANDTVDNGDMDKDCGAMLEGPSRAARAANYLAYIHGIAPNAPHVRIVIPGVAHDADAMFSSPLAWPSLFGVYPRGGQ
jgi:pimeloyl-ACP methyl ester carboxylesterase